MFKITKITIGFFFVLVAGYKPKLNLKTYFWEFIRKIPKFRNFFQKFFLAYAIGKFIQKVFDILSATRIAIYFSFLSTSLL